MGVKTAIVTGASGFIGGNVVRALVDDGFFVLALTGLTPGVDVFSKMYGNRVVYTSVPMSEYSTLSRDIIKSAFGETEPFYFFHFAWEASAGQGRKDYARQLLNVKYSCDAVFLAARLGCRRFIGAGSIMEDECQAYITNDGSRPTASNHYSIAKLTAHMMCKTAAYESGIDFLWGKISNAYGEGDTTTRFINTMIGKMQENEPCELTAGEQLYDFIYSTEVGRAFLSIAQNGKSQSSYYIGAKAKKLREYILEMKTTLGSDSVLKFGAIPYNGIFLDKTHFDVTKLFADTGFMCEISFTDGLRRTLSWLANKEG